MITNYDELKTAEKNFKNMSFGERKQFFIDKILYYDRIGILTYEKYHQLTYHNNYLVSSSECDCSDWDLLKSETKKLIIEGWEKEQEKENEDIRRSEILGECYCD